MLRVALIAAGLLVSLAGGAEPILWNEAGEAKAMRLEGEELTPGALIDQNGTFFCNGFVARVEGEPRILTAGHCLETEGDIWFYSLNAEGLTRKTKLDLPPVFRGELEIDGPKEAPVDLAVLKADLSFVPKFFTVEAQMARADFSQSPRIEVIYFHHPDPKKVGDGAQVLQLYSVACSTSPSVPKVRVSLKDQEGKLSSRKDFQIGLSRKGIAYDEEQGLFLDRCERPLPPGASGALIREGKRPVGLLHTGVTTKQFQAGWVAGGWADAFWKDAGDGALEQHQNGDNALSFHYLASDLKAYGPLSEERLLNPKSPLFLFGAGLRISQIPRFLK